MTGRRIVLVGAGHAHLFSLKRAAAFAGAGHDLTVVAPGPFWYSGLATGVLGGAYPPELDQVDVATLVARGGGRFVCDRATGIDRQAGLLHLADGAPLPFDLLSLTLGSEPPSIPGAADTPGCFAVKPVPQLLALRREIERRVAAAPSGPLRIVLAGGGVTALELAANAEALVRRRGGRAEVTVLAAGERLLRQLSPAAAERVERGLAARGVTCRRQARVARVAPGTAELENGTAVPFDLFVNATGLKPAPLLRAFGVPLDREGAMIVDGYLRSPADPRLFGAGDCIELDGHDLPRVGVHAIRQAPVLFHNLLAAAGDAALRPYRPQRRHLWIMNLGDGTGLAARGRLWWHGRSAWWLKDRIDRRFLAAYQRAARD
ncbi:NAD(P)/FAD-dependent oxidoreductase [Rhodospirillum centenum]|uniref:Pyridine nucleotide-disulphide oxidoreductase, putative n=1 Tax=Rhodospirillum centenum (strain ATCC 51521 / SW) TaxID=414684 RepID=B6ITD2_RHOCS|nr:FAD-dependent oxidoreductase [Rhodospirillum centenum]ACI99150.1 pyridine nucleotide-disulphide oxidoreductase, putative [Rhodospirillum centenum SW]